MAGEVAGSGAVGDSTPTANRAVSYVDIREGDNSAGNEIKVVNIGSNRRHIGGEINTSLYNLARFSVTTAKMLGHDSNTGKTSSLPPVAATFSHDTNSSESLANGFKDTGNVSTGYLPVTGDTVLTQLDKLTKQVAYTNYVMNRQGGMRWQSGGVHATPVDTTSSVDIVLEVDQQYRVGESELMVYISGKNRVLGVEYAEVGTPGSLSNTVRLIANEFPPDKWIDIYAFTQGGNYSASHSHSGYALTTALNTVQNQVNGLSASTGSVNVVGLQSQVNAIDGRVTTNTGDISAMQTELNNNYVTNSSLSSTLGNYITSSSQATVLAGYVTDSELDIRVPATGTTDHVLTMEPTGPTFKAVPSVIPAGVDGQLLGYSGTTLTPTTLLNELPTSGEDKYLKKDASGSLVWDAPSVNTGTSAINKKVLTVTNQGTFNSSLVDNNSVISSYTFDASTTYATFIAITNSIFENPNHPNEQASDSFRMEIKNIDTSSPAIEVYAVFLNITVNNGATNLTAAYQGKNTLALNMGGSYLPDFDLEFKWEDATKTLTVRTSCSRTDVQYLYTGTMMEYQEVVIADGNAVFASKAGTVGQHLVRTGPAPTQFEWQDQGGPGTATGRVIQAYVQTDRIPLVWVGDGFLGFREYSVVLGTAATLIKGQGVTTLSVISSGEETSYAWNFVYNRDSNELSYYFQFDTYTTYTTSVIALGVSYSPTPTILGNPYGDGVAAGAQIRFSYDAITSTLSIRHDWPQSGTYTTFVGTLDSYSNVTIGDGSVNASELLPLGGTADQILVKQSATDGDSTWESINKITDAYLPVELFNIWDSVGELAIDMTNADNTSFTLNYVMGHGALVGDFKNENNLTLHATFNKANLTLGGTFLAVHSDANDGLQHRAGSGTLTSAYTALRSVFGSIGQESDQDDFIDFKYDGGLLYLRFNQVRGTTRNISGSGTKYRKVNALVE